MAEKELKESKTDEEPLRHGLPESVKQKKRLGKENEFSPYFDLKVEVAEELGLLDKVRRFGWGALSTKESGRLGGYMTRHLKEREQKPETEE